MKNSLRKGFICMGLVALALCSTQAQKQTHNVDSLKVDGGVNPEQGTISIVATISDPSGTEKEEKLIYSLSTDSTVSLSNTGVQQMTTLTASVKNGELKQLVVGVSGGLPVEAVSGENIKSWSLQRTAKNTPKGGLFLVIDLAEPLKEGSLTCVVEARATDHDLPKSVLPLFFTPPDANLSAGTMRLNTDAKLSIKDVEVANLYELDKDAGQIAYSFTGGDQSLSFRLLSKQRPNLQFTNFKLDGAYEEGRFRFLLKGDVEVFNPGKFKLGLLNGIAAFSSAPRIEGAKILYEGDRYHAVFEEPGTFAINLTFDAKVVTEEGRSSVQFDTLDSAFQPVSLKGIPVDPNRVHLNGFRLKGEGDTLNGSLAGNGIFNLTWTDPSWKSPKAGAAPLFYAVESVSRLEVGPGLVRQESKYSVRIMQGSMRTLVVDVEGDGEITQVIGGSILRWAMQDGEVEGSRQLVLTLNRPYKDNFDLQVRSQYALAAFPAKAQPLRLLPVDAIRYSGYIRIMNKGAVSIDVPESQGFAQISPEHFPGSSEAISAGAQVLAYRFSDVNFDYTIIAEDIVPEVSVSQVLLYQLGAEDQSLQGDLELTIRKAPLRDFYIEVPEGYSLSNLQVPNMADYFLLDSDEGRQLRIVFAQPLTGRHRMEVAFENNRSLESETWTLPTFRPIGVKNIRGHVGVTVEPGLRVKVSSIEGLVEQAVNFFPKTVESLQIALRLREPSWSSTLKVEKLPQAVQADLLRLFSVGEGRIYGSTVANFLISGAPVSEFQIQVPDGMENIDFVGRDIRGWAKNDAGVYEVRLHSPASGPYTLLCTYESKLNPQGGEVVFQGVDPIGVASEQGYLVVVSNFPYSIGALEYASDLIRLEPNEIPAEFRLLYDAQVLAAFQYTNSPKVTMELRSPEQAKAKEQVIDFANLKSRISGDGQILTEVDLMLKSKGKTHFRMQLPANHKIWTARVEGKKVYPISTEEGILLPLPAGHDPASAIRVWVELAAESEDPYRPVVYAPALHAPSLTLNWELTSDPDFGLRYLDGSISSGHMSGRDSGFAWLSAVLAGAYPPMRLIFFAMLAFGAITLFIVKVLIQKFGKMGILLRVFLILSALALMGGVAVSGIILGGINIPQEVLRDTISLKAPIELSSEPLQLQLSNQPYGVGIHGVVFLLPVIIGLGLWVYGFMAGKQRNLFWALGWLGIFFGALASTGGGVLFIISMMLFFLLNALRPVKDLLMQSGRYAAIWTIGLMAMAIPANDAEAKSVVENPFSELAVVNQITEDIVVEDWVARVEASLQWRAEVGERCRILNGPVTLLDGSDVPEGLRLIQLRDGRRISYELEAVEDGDYTYEFSYRMNVTAHNGASYSIPLPVGMALSHQARISIPEANVNFSSDQAVSVQSVEGGAKRSVFDVLFRPSDSTVIKWSPERRDTSKEAAVFYVESQDLYTPLVGLISGYHSFQVRLAQGQLDAMKLNVPEGMTITAVEASKLASWHFDPTARALMLYFEPVQQGSFDVSVFSQYGSGSLPYEHVVRPLKIEGAASQLSLVGLASDPEVQIGDVAPVEATTLNLEDFPSEHVKSLSYLGRVPQLRRAYRWDAETGALKMQALAVEPDIRTTIKQTVSLGEDRVLLALELKAEINRTGVFKLSLAMPDGYDVETVSGQQLSHWNQSTGSSGERILQLHLNGKTMGSTAFNLSLSGPGLADQTSYSPPILQLAETDRQTGTLILVPELGYRLQAKERDAAVQLDPSKAGIKQKNIMLYRILNQQAKLDFAVERVDPWIELERVESVAVRSGAVEVRARFNFTVENAGIREQVFLLPDDAIGVQFSGEPLADARETESGKWLLKLKRKMVGAFSLNLAYQMPTPDQPDRINLQGVEVEGANQQSGYLALVPHGRIQLVPEGALEALQPAESQMIESKLRGDLVVDEASHVYRIMEPSFNLGLQVKRHEIADLVPAQVRDVQLASTISGAGSVLTKVTLKLDPGDKRMLRITLPADSEFWFGYVNQQSVWPWNEDGDVLLQLESSAIEGEDSIVEFFYATQLNLKGGRKVDTSLVGPRLDLPLANISWTLYYPETWQIEEWDGNLTVDEHVQGWASVTNMKDYMQLERESRQKKKSQAESMLTEANVLLEQGKQEQARYAFSSAYNLSQSDAALNEDARVQLQNVREQQALVAIANRRNMFINDNAGTQVANQQWEAGEEDLLNFTDKIVRDVLGGNSEDDNNALRLLASRLIDQQQAVPAKPQAIDTTLPQQGQTASFSRSLQINDSAELFIEIEGKRLSNGRAGASIGILLLLAGLAFGFSAVSGRKD